MQIVDSEGDEMFRLKYGTPATVQQVQDVVCRAVYAEASGQLELDECSRILGRKLSGQVHRFGNEATEEIVLNWSR